MSSAGRLHNAVRSNNVSMLQNLLNSRADVEEVDDDGHTPIVIAVQCGYGAAMILLLDRGANIESTDSKGRTILAIATENLYGAENVLHGVENRHGAVCESLLKKGAASNAIMLTNEHSRRLLSIAARDGRIGLCVMLLERGANVDSTDNGQTPLAIAAFGGRREICELLLKKGANVEAIDNGRTIVASAAARSQRLWGVPKTREICEFLLVKGAMRPLIIATTARRIEICALLLEKGANIEANDEAGRTPLIIAKTEGWIDTCALLLEKGANTEAHDHGRTPLIIATTAGWKEICALLLEKGANGKAIDHDGKTPLEIAAKLDPGYWLTRASIWYMLRKAGREAA